MRQQQLLPLLLPPQSFPAQLLPVQSPPQQQQQQLYLVVWLLALRPQALVAVRLEASVVW